MANWVENRLEIRGDKDEIQKFLDFAKTEVNEFDFNKINPYPEEFAKLDKESAGEGYISGGSRWCSANWGTKCNSDEVEVYDREEYSEIWFITIWSAPLPILERIAALYPTLTFRLKFGECNLDFAGIRTFKGTECLEEEDDEITEVDDEEES